MNDLASVRHNQIHTFRADVGGTHTPFFGDPEDCGYTHRDDGRWVDVLGNTGALVSEDVDVQEASHREVLRNFWCGDDAFERTESNWRDAAEFLAGECGLTAEQATVVVEGWFTDEPEAATCPSCLQECTAVITGVNRTCEHCGTVFNGFAHFTFPQQEAATCLWLFCAPTLTLHKAACYLTRHCPAWRLSGRSCTSACRSLSWRSNDTWLWGRSEPEIRR